MSLTSPLIDQDLCLNTLWWLASGGHDAGEARISTTGRRNSCRVPHPASHDDLPGPLGQQGQRVYKKGAIEIWKRRLAGALSQSPFLTWMHLMRP